MTGTSRRAALADIREFLFRAGALAVLLVLLFGVVFGLALQPDDTMHPHIKPGDLLLFYRLPRGYTAGEVVVLDKDGRRYTGRVARTRRRHRGGDGGKQSCHQRQCCGRVRYLRADPAL